MTKCAGPDGAFSGLCRQYIEPVIGRKATDLLEKGASNPKRWLTDTVIEPNLFNADRSSYYHVSDSIYTPGRNETWARFVSTEPNLAKTVGPHPLDGLTYFCNELKIVPGPTVGEDGVELEVGVRPSERTSLGQHHIFTFEFDVPDVGYLTRQFSWVMPTKNPLDCPMGEFFRTCSGHADFAGISVNWAGNKSLHIHVVYRTELADATFGLGTRSSADLRAGFIAHWHRLHEILLATIDTDGRRADLALRFPEALRRLPNGARTVEEGHLLGIPAGIVLPQVTVWERSRERTSGDELPLFFTPDLFATTPLPSERPARVRASKVGPMSDAQVAYCSARLRDLYPEWPRFAHLTYEGGRWVAMFRNSEQDRMPSSIMREDYQTIQMVGRDVNPAGGKKLPFVLGLMLRQWRHEMDSPRDDQHDEPIDPARLAVKEREKRFRENVVSKVTAREEMDTFFKETVSSTALMMVVGPEGVGKTTTIMLRYKWIARDLWLKGESQRGMFAVADYKTARQKCDAFNELQTKNGFFGVVLPSFSRAYNEACAKLGVSPMTIEEAGWAGYRDLFEAIRKRQPGVISEFKRRHKKIWTSIGDRVPVFFVVHDTLHVWSYNCPTRLMWAPSFWTAQTDNQHARLDLLRKQMTIGVAVHDEIKRDHIVRCERDEVVAWVMKLVAADAVWHEDSGNLPELLKAYETFRTKNGFPVVLGEPVAISFQKAREIAAIKPDQWDRVVTRDSGEYRAAPRNATDDEHVDIYEDRHGQDWRVREHDWWDGVAHTLIMLTTEKLPTALVRACKSPWIVYELDAPLVPKDAANTHIQRSVVASNLPEVCTKFRAERPDDDYFCVSNKVAMMEDTMPHVTARGSNELIGRNIMQTMTFVSPALYEELQVLNAWTGRSDLVGLNHIDEFNQTAGRNLGFRSDGKAKHDLVVSRRLFKLLSESGALAHARYRLQPVLDKQARYDAVRR